MDSRENQSSRIVFSKNGAYAAFGTKNGEIVLIRQHQLLGKSYTTHKLSAKQDSIYSISFSKDGKYLAACSVDGKISLWNANEQRLIETVSLYSKRRASVCFSNDSNYLIYGSDKKTLVVHSISGSEKAIKINVAQEIFDIKMSETGNNVVVLTEMNQLHFYDIRSGKEKGYIPSYDTSFITDFCFSSNDSKILIGHRSGYIFLFNVKDVFLKPDELPPSLKVFSSANAGGGTGSGASYGSLPVRNLSYKKGHFLDFRFNASYAQDPFNWNFDFDFGYINSSLGNNPFYLGALLGMNIGLPCENFPYRYRLNNKVEKDPYLLSFLVTVPFGLCFMPFANDVYITTEVDAGVSMNCIWNGNTGSDYLVSNGGAAFFAGATLGAGYKPFVVHVTAKYDFCQGFIVSGGAGCNLKIGKGRLAA